MFGLLSGIARALGRMAAPAQTSPAANATPSSSIETPFTIQTGCGLEGLPLISLALKSSVTTQGDSDYLRTVDQGRHLHITELDGETNFLLSTENGSVAWTAESGQFLSGVCNGQLFLSQNKNLVVRDLKSGQEVKTLTGYTALGPNHSGSQFFALDPERHMCRLDTKTNNFEVLWRSETPWPKDAPLSGCFSNCGQYFSVQTGPTLAEMWEVASARCIFRGYLGRGSITRMRPHPTDPVFAFSSMGGLVCLLDARNPKEVFIQPLACESRGVGFTSDGNYMVAINSDDHEFLWVMDYRKKQLFAPYKLKGDPWGVAAWGKNQIAVAHSNRIDFYEFEVA